MSRLIDKLFYEHGDFGYVREARPATIDEFRQKLSVATPILIDNVARYYFENKGLSKWALSDFPNIAPPFENYWMEFKGISPLSIGDHTYNPDMAGYNPLDVPRACGLLVESYEVGPDDIIQPAYDEVDNVSVEYDKSEIKWYTRCTICYDSRSFPKPHVIGSFHIYITPEGVQHETSKRRMQIENYWMTPAVRNDGEDPVAFAIRERQQVMKMKVIMGHFARLVLMPCLLATTFLHCGNVTVEDDKSVSPKVARSYQKRKKRALVQFKTLNIGQVTRTLKSAGAESDKEGMGLKHALHIRRGHFAYYGMRHPQTGRQQGKLFGRYSGMVWRPEKDMGDSEAGVVEKQYAISPQEQTP